MELEIDVSGTVADDRITDRRNIDWLNLSEDRRARIRRSRDRMQATREEVQRLCSAPPGWVHRPATDGEILRIAQRGEET